jgi:hypothetical protein
MSRRNMTGESRPTPKTIRWMISAMRTVARAVLEFLITGARWSIYNKGTRYRTVYRWEGENFWHDHHTKHEWDDCYPSDAKSQIFDRRAGTTTI